MNIKNNIKATGVELTPEINAYLDKRLSALGKFVDPNDDANICYVELAKISEHHRTGDIFKAEFTLHVGGKSFRAVAEEADLNTAIDKAKDELLRELRKSKTKRINLIRRGGRSIKDFIKGFRGWGGRNK